MIILRAIPLSFAILWRYVLVLPFVVLGLLAFGILCGVFAILSAIVSPILSILVIFAFAIAASVIPVMVGARLGMQAQGVIPKNGYMGMLGPAIGYGFFEGFCVLLILTGTTALYLAVTPMTAAELMQLADLPDDQVIPALLAVSPAVTLSLIGLAGFSVFLLRAALLVPLTGAAIGFDPEGRSHTPFYGFGTSVLTLMVLVIATYILWALVLPVMAGILSSMDYVDVLSNIEVEMQEEGADLWAVVTQYSTELSILAGGALLLYLWVLSFQCAGAAAAYAKIVETADQRRIAFERAAEEALIQQRQQNGDPQMMDLVRSRMPQTRS